MSNSEVDKAAEAAAEKRQPRQSRLVKASFGCERFGRFDITIRNVSETGLGGQAPHALNIGERVTVYLPGHSPMKGTVRWVVDRKFGVETDAKIEPGRLRASNGEPLVAADSTLAFQAAPDHHVAAGPDDRAERAGHPARSAADPERSIARRRGGSQTKTGADRSAPDLRPEDGVKIPGQATRRTSLPSSSMSRRT